MEKIRIESLKHKLYGIINCKHNVSYSLYSYSDDHVLFADPKEYLQRNLYLGYLNE
jgi:hypothetical protein